MAPPASKLLCNYLMNIACFLKFTFLANVFDNSGIFFAAFKISLRIPKFSS